MLDITPSSFYFLFVAPALVDHYCNLEPLAFLRGAPGCSVPAWNLGLFGHDGLNVPFLSASNKDEICGVLVVPAMAVDAQQPTGTSASLNTILPNCVPLWYWFGQLFVPGFIGDRSSRALAAARNVGATQATELLVGVRYSLELGMGNG
jgi:hypothetical protein